MRISNDTEVTAERHLRAASGEPEPVPESAPPEQWWSDPPDLANLPPAPPAILARSDGLALVPEGRHVTVYGRPGGGKSWLALAAVAAAIRAGRRAIYWDFEGTTVEMFRRLALLGAYREPGDDLAGDTDVFRYATGGRLDKRGVGPAVKWLGETGLLALDSVGKSGGATDSSRDYYEWHADTVGPFRWNGITVLLVDHTAKHEPKGGRPAGAIGSQARHAEADIGLYLSGEPWTPRASGYVVARLEKDRYGDTGVQAGHSAAILRGSWSGKAPDRAFGLTIDPPTETETEPTDVEQLETDIIAAIYSSGGFDSLNKLARAVGRRRETVSEVAQRLHHEGRIVRQATGKGLRFAPPPKTATATEPEPEPETLL